MKLTDLVEAFDSSLELQWKSLSGGGIAAGFTVDDTNYVVQLTPIVIGDLKVDEASFHLYDVSGDKAFATAGTSTVPTTVYGVVINGLIQKLPALKCDAVFFSAERRHAANDKQHEQKLKLYKLAAQRIAKKLGWETYTDKNEFLLTREYQGATIGSFKHWQEEIREMQLPCAKLVRSRF
jgi:hypothetical protein